MGESVRLIDEGGQAIFYDLLYRADVVDDTFGECTQGCEDILRLFYSLLDCSADEFCEGFAYFSSLEFGVILTLPPQPSPGSAVGILADSISEKGGNYA